MYQSVSYYRNIKTTKMALMVKIEKSKIRKVNLKQMEM